jgi:hypothetical protein
MATTAGDGQLEYRRKVDCLRSPDEVDKESRTRRLNKGSKHTANNDGEGGAGKKRQRTGGS